MRLMKILLLKVRFRLILQYLCTHQIQHTAAPVALTQKPYPKRPQNLVKCNQKYIFSKVNAESPAGGTLS